MRRRSRKQQLVSEINITPLTDVILVLLVIFMIATPLISQASIRVRLPDAKSGKPIEPAPRSHAYITVTNEGPVYLDEKLVTRKELREKISALHKSNANLGVILRSDRLVRFKDIVEILDLLTELGITRLDIASTTPK